MHWIFSCEMDVRIHTGYAFETTTHPSIPEVNVSNVFKSKNIIMISQFHLAWPSSKRSETSQQPAPCSDGLGFQNCKTDVAVGEAWGEADLHGGETRNDTFNHWKWKGLKLTESLNWSKEIGFDLHPKEFSFTWVCDQCLYPRKVSHETWKWWFPREIPSFQVPSEFVCLAHEILMIHKIRHPSPSELADFQLYSYNYIL